MHSLISLGCVASLTIFSATAVYAQSSGYPAKPIKILVGSTPGAPSDVVARVLSERLSARFKQTVIVENRPGAGNNLAASQTAKADPDGYTVLVSPDTVVTVNPLIYRKADFKATTDLVPVSLLASFSQMLVCGSASKVSSVPELLARAKSQGITYASGGQGVPGHLAAEMFVTATGAKMTHIPYKGPGPATADVLGGQVDCGFLTTPVVLPHIQSGRLKALAVSSSRPSPLAPDVPTLPVITAKPDLDATFNQYLFVPKGTPQNIISELQRASSDIFRDPAVQAKLAALDMSTVGSTAADAAKTLARDTEKWRSIVQGLNLKLEE